MARSKCSKDLYKSFLQASSVRYSGKALSEVSPINLSHDSASRWLNSKDFILAGSTEKYQNILIGKLLVY